MLSAEVEKRRRIIGTTAYSKSSWNFSTIGVSSNDSRFAIKQLHRQ